MSRLDLVVAPNGARRSTFVELVLSDARLWDNVVPRIELADSAEVFDDTGPGSVTIATFATGEVVGAPRWPGWTPEALTARWPVPDDPH